MRIVVPEGLPRMSSMTGTVHESAMRSFQKRALVPPRVSSPAGVAVVL